MVETEPVYVYSEAFLRCAPWTPISFRVQQSNIVKCQPGEEDFLINSVKCLEAFGVRSNIDDVCAHLRRFKDSELAKRVFRNLRYWRESEPADLITAFELSVDVKGDRTSSFHTNKVSKGFLEAFLRFCRELTNGNKIYEQKLKYAFIDAFDGLSPSNFTLKLKSSGRNFKKKSNRWIHIVHASGRNSKQRYDTMISHLAFLAPRGWGMYSDGGPYPGDYRQWRLPPAFKGFELNTDPDQLDRDWTAMEAANISCSEKPALDTVINFIESIKEKKRKFVTDTRDDEEEVTCKTRRYLQRPDKHLIDLTDDTPPPTPTASEATQGTASDLGDLDSQDEILTRPQNEANEEQEVKYSVHDVVEEVLQRTVIQVPFDPQPSTSSQIEQMEATPQQGLVMTNSVISMQRLPKEGDTIDGPGTSCAGIPVPVILPPPNQVSEIAASQEDVDMEPAEALTTPSASSFFALSAARDLETACTSSRPATTFSARTSAGTAQGQRYSAGSSQGQRTSAESSQGQRTSAETIQEKRTSEGTAQGQRTSAKRTKSQKTSEESTLGQTTSAGSTQGQRTSAGRTKSQKTSEESTLGQTISAGNTQGQRTYAESSLEQRTSSETAQGQRTSAETVQGERTSEGTAQGQRTSAERTKGQKTSEKSTLGQITSAGNIQRLKVSSNSSQGQQTSAGSVQEQRTSAESSRGQRTSAESSRGQRTSAESSRGQRTSAERTKGHKTSEERTLAQMFSPGSTQEQRTSAKSSQEQRTSSGSSQRHKTSSGSAQRQRTSAESSQRHKTSAGSSQRHKTSAGSTEGQGTSEGSAQEITEIATHQNIRPMADTNVTSQNVTAASHAMTSDSSSAAVDSHLDEVQREILNVAWESPEVRRAVACCFAKLMEEYSKSM